MKRFYSFALALTITLVGHSQAVLNEIYAYPSVGNNEFFELYNTSTGNTPSTVDDYMLVSYFDDGKDVGFYVMDMPNMMVDPKGYFVGSSAIPFNYQGTLNSTNSDFSWNDAFFRNGSTFGYLKKWVKSKTIGVGDKNPFYDEASVPTDFNDFFSKIKGNGASFNTFLFKDGNLMNSFLGGTGGTALIPQVILDMPVLMLQNVTASGSSWYGTNFSKYKAIEAENVIQDIGSDNGYMRTRDGMCGTWEKSSAQAFHTPKTTNGSWSQMDIVGALTLETHISRGYTPGDSSFVTYRITSGPTDMFPAELYVYADNGSVDDEWDANDVFLKADTQYVADDTTFVTRFLPQDQELIVVIKTIRGCYDQVRLIANPEPIYIPLPVKLKAFTAKARDNGALLEWVVTSNETGERFEIERSANGKDFTTVGVVSATTRANEEYYTFQTPQTGSTYYRLKIINKDGSTSLSPVVLVKDGTATSDNLFIVQNPVETTLMFTYGAAQSAPCTINLYNALGVKLLTVQKAAQKGTNTYSLNLDARFTPGTYILEVTNHSGNSVKRFIKH